MTQSWENARFWNPFGRTSSFIIFIFFCKLFVFCVWISHPWRTTNNVDDKELQNILHLTFFSPLNITKLECLMREAFFFNDWTLGFSLILVEKSSSGDEWSFQGDCPRLGQKPVVSSWWKHTLVIGSKPHTLCHIEFHCLMTIIFYPCSPTLLRHPQTETFLSGISPQRTTLTQQYLWEIILSIIRFYGAQSQ